MTTELIINFHAPLTTIVLFINRGRWFYQLAPVVAKSGIKYTIGFGCPLASAIADKELMQST